MPSTFSLDKAAGSQNDEFYTPDYAVEPILPFVPPGATVWCPFDTERSLFVRMLHARGHDVVFSHKDTGTDFFAAEPPEFDVLISNPPYSKKTEVLARCFSFKKPFALLLGVVGLFESRARFEMFRDNRFEVLYFNKRISYLKSYDDEKPALNPPFSSVYITSGLLPKQVMFSEVQRDR